MAIQKRNFNQARSILAQAGSDAASKTHVAHESSVPDGYGVSLLREARDEFRGTDAGQPNLHSGMTEAHHAAIANAASVMGIVQW